MKKNVRLKDIAEKLNLTKVSVSKALRDHPDISEETRRKVKEVANELGYRPNAVARSLTSSKSKMIGVIIPKMAHFFFASVMEAIQKVAYSNGYELVLGVSFENKEIEKKHLETMMEMRVDGILISISEETKDPQHFEPVRNLGIELVFFDRGFEDAGFSYIRANDYERAKEGVRQLIDQGHKNIAHLAGFFDINIGKERRRGFVDALKDAGLPLPDSAIVEAGFGDEAGYRGFEKLLNTHGAPEALFTATYPIGLGAMQCMKAHDIDPNDVPILAFGKSGFNKYISSPFQCVDQPTSELGEKACYHLLSQINAKGKSAPELIDLIPEKI